MSIFPEPVDPFDGSSVLYIDSVDAIAFVDHGRTSIIWAEHVDLSVRTEITPNLYRALGDPAEGVRVLVVPLGAADRFASAPYLEDDGDQGDDSRGGEQS